jgi:NaMN:DMB phosphoribosyltransferase
VAQDRQSDVAGLFQDLGEFPAVAANLDFSRSPHAPLRQYELGLVKEGVGAGGAAVAYLWQTGSSVATLRSEIDRLYTDYLARGLVAGH